YWDIQKRASLKIISTHFPVEQLILIDNKLIASGANFNDSPKAYIKIWNIDEVSLYNTYTGHCSEVLNVLSVKNLVVSHTSNEIQIWDPFTLKTLDTIKSDYKIRGIFTTGNNIIIVFENEIRLYNSKTKKSLSKMIDYIKYVNHLN